jgi:hypothetical protein
MYQLLTGSAPFAAFGNEAPAAVILRIIRDPVRPLRADWIPIGLSDLLEVALAKDPGQRPASALEFAAALVGVEASAGWPRTPCVVWDPGGLASPAPGTPGPAPASPAARAPTAADSWPAAQTPAEARPAQVSTPDGLAGPPRSPAHHGPSVAAPEAAPRRVLMPDRAETAPEGLAQPTAGPPGPLRKPPRETTDPGSGPPPPVFVDPSAPSHVPRLPEPEPQDPARASRVPVFASPRIEEAAAAAGPHLTWSPLLIAGLASAALVVVAALLLVVGVL